MVAMDESASMLCARVMRGISSMENAVTPVAASSRMVSSCPSGRTNPTRTWPARSSGRSAWPVTIVGAMAEHLDDHVSQAEDLGSRGDELRAFGGVFGIQVPGGQSGAQLR
jgi:hypothetical protein